jgi:glycosyltransferase involved in cell wall biosynthesis
MKKIAIDARFLLRSQRGMPLYVFMLCRLLPLIMKTAHFYMLINKGFDHNESEDNYKERLKLISEPKNVTVINIETEDENSWEQFHLVKWLRENSPDLLHMPTNRVCLLSSTPQISTIHDCMEWTNLRHIYAIPPNTNLKLRLYIYRQRFNVWMNYKFGLKKLCNVLTISKYSASSIICNFPFLENKIDYVYHGVPEGFVNDSNKNKLIKRQGVLMLGGDSYHKNPENAIHAWALLPKNLRELHPLTIAGFTGNNDSRIMKMISELNLINEVKILRWVSQEKLVDLFQSSASLLFVSREEGFGFPLLQAMACGTPVVCSRAEVLPEIGADAVLVASAEEPKQIYTQLTKVLSDDDIWLSYHHKSLERAKEFSWQRAAEKIATIYQQQMTK